MLHDARIFRLALIEARNELANEPPTVGARQLEGFLEELARCLRHVTDAIPRCRFVLVSRSLPSASAKAARSVGRWYAQGGGTMRLTAAINKEDDMFVAQCLEVDVASQGDTIESALANLKEALELYFEDVPPV